MNYSVWTNSSVFRENYVNDSYDLQFYDIFLLVVCNLGLPGNLLVIAVYILNMKTSTRVYMFALAIADLTVCVVGVVMTAPYVIFNEYWTKIFEHLFWASVYFSVILLAFVSIERLIAVKRPHAFSMDSRRAKTALLIIALISTLCTTVTKVTYRNKTEVFEIAFISSGIIVMIICYTLIAVGQLKKICCARNRIANENVARLRNVEPSSAGPSRCADTAQSIKPGPSCVSIAAKENNMLNSAIVKAVPPAVTKAVTAKQASSYKNVFLLFVITLVFIACWMPRWVAFSGKVNWRVTSLMKRIFFVNSVVNPFIYGVASAMFREDVRQFYRQTRVKLSTCWHWSHTMVGSIYAPRGRETVLPSNSR